MTELRQETGKAVLGTDFVTESDPLSRLFRLIRIARLVVGEAAFSPPWGIAVPPGQLSFYAVRSGCCHMKRGSTAATHHLNEGDFVLLAGGEEHSLRDDPASDTTPLPIVVPTQQASDVDKPDRSGDCLIVYGHAPLEQVVGNLFKQYLPNLIWVHRDACELMKAADPLFDMVSNECRLATCGSQSIAEQLVRVLIMHVIRSYVLADDARIGDGEAVYQSRVLRAPADPRIGSVLDAIHARPGEPWTVIGMAKRSQMSKSAFSDLFRQIVGKPPMQYVTSLRIHEACELLSETDLTIKQIAALLGYGAASSFSTAFHRELGRSPMAYRDDTLSRGLLGGGGNL